MSFSKPTMTIAKCLTEWAKAKSFEAEKRGTEYVLDDMFWFRPSSAGRSGSTGGDCRFPSSRIEDFLWKEFNVYVRRSEDRGSVDSGVWSYEEGSDEVFEDVVAGGLDRRFVEEVVMASERRLSMRINAVRGAMEYSIEEAEGRIRREITLGKRSQTVWIDTAAGPTAVVGAKFFEAAAREDSANNNDYRRLSSEVDEIQERAEETIRRTQEKVVPTTKAKFVNPKSGARFRMKMVYCKLG